MRATTKGITFPRITCPGCGRTVTKRRTDGLIRHHRTPDGHPCYASGIDPGGQSLLTIQVPAFLLIRLAEASTDQVAAQEARMLTRKAQDTWLTYREAV